MENNTGLQIMDSKGNQVQTIIGSNAASLTQILVDNIAKVNSDPAFIPQAKEIRDSVHEIANLAKMEIDALREFRKLDQQRG